MSRELVTVFLRSGHSVEVECDNWEFKINNDTSYKSYTFNGFNKGEFYSFNVNEIVGYKAITIN